MPNYTFKCLSCESEHDIFLRMSELDNYRDNNLCSCGGHLRTVIKGSGEIQPFKAGIYEHFTDKPIYIGSKRDLKDACERYDCGSVYLDDGIPG